MSEQTLVEQEEPKEKFYKISVEIKPAVLIGSTLRSLDDKVAREMILNMLKIENVPLHLVTTRGYLRNLIRRDPLMRIAMRLSGKRLTEIDGEIEEEGELITIFDKKNEDFGRRALIVFFMTIEHVITLFGKHPKFQDMLNLIQQHMNEFFDKYAYYKTIARIEKVSDEPVVRITIYVMKGE